MADLDIITSNIVVISPFNDIPEEIWKEIDDSNPERCHCQIYLKPSPFHVKAREWLAERGIKWNGTDDDEYVL